MFTFVCQCNKKNLPLRQIKIIRKITSTKCSFFIVTATDSFFITLKSFQISDFENDRWFPHDKIEI